MPIEKKPTSRILETLRQRLHSEGFKEGFRRSPKDFTRDRKMPFDKVIQFIMKLSRRSLQVDLTAFMGAIPGKARNITTSAFCQSRKKLDPLLFKDLLQVMDREFDTDNDARIRLWRGMRLLATDGSTLVLPPTPELDAFYGRAPNQHATMVVSARCSVLFDVLNEMVIDGVLAPFHVGERDLAREHLPHCGKGDLVIYDRGYPGFELMGEVLQRGAHFLMRCKKDHNNHVVEFLAGKDQNRIVSMAPSRAIPTDAQGRKRPPIQVRMVKVHLPQGEVEVLLTSLLDQEQWPLRDFKDLYYKRWRVECFFDLVKNTVCMEQFTGHSPMVIQQDFHCALLMCNIHSLLVSEAEEELPTRHKGRKHAYKINDNVSFGHLKNELLRILANEDNEQMMADLKELFLCSTVPIRPGRSYPRNTAKYNTRKKPPCLPNSRPAL